MCAKSLLCILMVCFACVTSADERSNPLLSKATQVFGDSLNIEHRVFKLNEKYVLWLITDTDDDLIQVDVGPKSFYSSESPREAQPANPDYLTESEY
jgi:hypothetical protein